MKLKMAVILLFILPESIHAMESDTDRRIKAASNIIARQETLANAVCYFQKDQMQRDSLQYIANHIGQEIVKVTQSSDEIFKALSKNWELAGGKLRYRTLHAFAELKQLNETTLSDSEYFKLICMYGEKEKDHIRKTTLYSQMCDLIKYSAFQFDSPDAIISLIGKYGHKTTTMKQEYCASFKYFGIEIPEPTDINSDDVDNMLELFTYSHYVNTIFSKALSYCKDASDVMYAVNRKNLHTTYQEFLSYNQKINSVLTKLITVEQAHSMPLRTIAIIRGIINIKFYLHIPIASDDFFTQVHNLWNESFRIGNLNFNKAINAYERRERGETDVEFEEI